MANFIHLTALTTLIYTGLSLGANAADDPPPWAKPLPYGTLSCSEQSSSGVEWKDGHYQSTSYFKKRYSISRLKRDEIAKTLHFCKDKDRTPAHMMGDQTYWYSACYRFDNALNMLGSAQGWCTEIYQRDYPTRVICEFNQPALAFTPAGEFIAYGRSQNLMEPSVPHIPAAFTARGRCGGFTDAPPKPLGKFK